MVTLETVRIIRLGVGRGVSRFCRFVDLSVAISVSSCRISLQPYSF